MELSIFPYGLLQIDSSWPRMLKCSVVFTQYALTGLVSEHNAAVYSQACIRVQFRDYSLIARIKVKMKLGLM